jgi:hypothetical protein
MPSLPFQPSRRSVIAGLGAAGIAAAMPGPARASVLAAAYPTVLKFEVTREGSPIGVVMERFGREGDAERVDVYIAFLVRLLGIPVYRYEHRSREIWRDGRLIRLDTVTNDDGVAQTVRARPQGGVLLVEGAVGSIDAPRDILPSSYWHPSLIQQDRMLDSQTGRMLEIGIDRVGAERIVALGREIPAERYRMTGDLKLDLWFDAERVWQKMAFELKGGFFDYTRVAPVPGDERLFDTAMSTGVIVPPLGSG